MQQFSPVDPSQAVQREVDKKSDFTYSASASLKKESHYTKLTLRGGKNDYFGFTWKQLIQ